MHNNKQKIRTRIAPSPTGPFHIGTARSALFNYIFALQNKGNFILRIEDTDIQRSDKRFEKDIIASLNWLNIKYQEFYKQSERTEIYKKYIEKLLNDNQVFWCHHTPEELNKEKREQIQKKEVLKHICQHKNQKPTFRSRASGRGKTKNQKPIIRLRGNDKKIKFNDLIRGEIEVDGSLLGDFAIAKNAITPLYNLAVVIDDYEMKISHVIRGEDHIPNTPKQILIHKALGLSRPLYAHLPLILGPDRSKLSKRHGAVAISEYKRQGYLSNALINFMALLGWNPGNEKEIIEQNELFKIFSLDRIQKGGAVFNIDKLNWFNKYYIKKMDESVLSRELLSYLPKDWQSKIQKDAIFWKKIIQLEKPRLTKLSEITEGIEFFFEKPNFTKSLLLWRDDNLNNVAQYLDKITKLLSGLRITHFTAGDIKETIWGYIEEKGRGNVLWPFRVALTGQAKSPDPFSVAEILGQKETLERLHCAKEMIYDNSKYKN